MTALDLDHLVQPDRVHRSVYTDQALFDLEMENMFEKTWVYCGHESQVKAVGDYHTLHIGRQPMVMVRDRDQSIRVLYNRCPHLPVQVKTPRVVGAHKARTGVAAVRAAQLHTAVRAAVVKHPDGLIAVAHHHHGLAANVQRVVIAQRLDLGLVATVDPGFFKHVFHFQVKQGLVGVHAAVHAVGLNQMVQV